MSHSYPLRAGSCTLSRIKDRDRDRSVDERSDSMWRGMKPAIIIAAALLAFVFKIALALNTYGTNDILTWEGNVAKIIADGGLAWYRDGVEIPVTFNDGSHVIRTQLNNHPPLLIHVLRAWDYLAHVSGLPFRFWLRFTSSLADIGSLLLVWNILTVTKVSIRLPALLLVAFSPVSVMVSGFHGNTDPVMVFLLLSSVYLIESGRPVWLAGAVFGLSMSVKVVPIIFVPVFLLYLPSMWKRTEFVLCAGGIFVAGFLPYLAQDPALIIHRVFGYSGTLGPWGLSWLIYVLVPEAPLTAYATVGKWLALCIVMVVSLSMNWNGSRPALFRQCGRVAFLFLFWAPGFGVQYLAWLVPWGAALTGRAIRFYYIASGVFLFCFYSLWSRGFPWFLANTWDHVLPFWPMVFVVLLELTCWISVGAVAFSYRRMLAPDSHSQEDTRMPRAYSMFVEANGGPSQS